MKRLLALSLLGSYLLTGLNPAKADWDSWGIKQSESDSSLYDVYTVDSDTQEATKVTQVCTDSRSGCIDYNMLKYNQSNINGLLVESSDGTFSEYDLISNTWSSTDVDFWYDDYYRYVSRTSDIFQDDNSSDFYFKGNYSSTILSDGTLRIGQDANDISFKNNEQRQSKKKKKKGKAKNRQVKYTNPHSVEQRVTRFFRKLITHLSSTA